MFTHTQLYKYCCPGLTTICILTLSLSSSFPASVCVSVCVQSLIEEQQTQLNQYECAAGQCVSELQKAQLQVQSLQAKIHESEANNKVALVYH